MAEVDFGRLGMIVDPATGRRRAVWGLIIVGLLAAQLRPDPWADAGGHQAGWKRRGSASAGCPSIWSSTIVAGPDPLHPRFTRGFLEYSQRRGFIADAARVRKPKDKPKVERGVQYVRERRAAISTVCPT